jgi:hypothetical protein
MWNPRGAKIKGEFSIITNLLTDDQMLLAENETETKS